MSVGTNGKFAMSEKVYDFSKDAALIYIPALSVLYAALAGIWGLPFAVQVVGTLVAIDTFLGVVLKISSASYSNAGGSADGTLQAVSGYPSKLNVELTPEELAGKAQVVLNVVHDSVDTSVNGVSTPPVDPSAGTPVSQ